MISAARLPTSTILPAASHAFCTSGLSRMSHREQALAFVIAAAIDGGLLIYEKYK
jgi:hypothetical protein